VATSFTPIDGPGDVSALWHVLEQRLDAFVNHWEEHKTPPALADHLPEGPAGVRRMVLVELIKIDLDYRAQHRQGKRIEEYAREFPELGEPHQLPNDLIFEEFQARRRSGESVRPDEYFERFPAQSERLARLFGVVDPHQTTAIGRILPPAEVKVGDRLDDFDLLLQLGRGAFAKVFLARQRSMHRLVALKVSVERGVEAQTLAQLDHPHIVRVFDQRVVSATGLTLLYMSYLPGGTLKDVITWMQQTPADKRTGQTLLAAVDQVLKDRGETPPVDSAARQRLSEMSWPETVCWLGARLAEALDYAHRQGVLHRDIKPANVLLGADASPRLADFNVGACSKLTGSGPAAIFGGSLPYMSPEQLEAFNPAHPRTADSLDGRSDVYSLAVTLWELLTGTRPFPDPADDDEMYFLLARLSHDRRLGVSPQARSQLPPTMPPGLANALLRALDPDPSRRHETAGDFARDLELCLLPRTRDLVQPAPGNWRHWARRHSVFAFYLVGLAPNLVAAAFSIYFNEQEIIWRDAPAAKAVFDRTTIWVNLIFFPLGIVLTYLFFRPMFGSFRRLSRGQVISEGELATIRRISLFMGSVTAGVCAALFAISGIIFPIVLHSQVPDLPASVTWHFLMSQLMCGLIAGSYPFFSLTWLAVRMAFPAFLSRAGLTDEDVRNLDTMEWWLGPFLVVAAAVPLLALGFYVMLIGATANRSAMAVVAFAGTMGLFAAWALTAATRRDLAALRALARR
jgi:serine/threonine protein kinase